MVFGTWLPTMEHRIQLLKETGVALTIDFTQPKLSPQEKDTLSQYWRDSIHDILCSTTLAECGHPGGSMSSLHFMLLLYAGINTRLQNILDAERDRVFISHGHISPGVYATLARYDFFPAEEMVIHFRKTASRYGGHVETGVPGVEWNTGNLGQGCSAAAGAALAAKIRQQATRAFVLMGDGEQQKGQISEARRFAVKYKLSNLIGFIDFNRFQIGGDIKEIMPQNIRENYESDGWNVIYVENGHDFDQLFEALHHIYTGNVANPSHPTLILAKTQMGYGVSFMQDIPDYHGVALKKEQLNDALQELNIHNDFQDLVQKRHLLPEKSKMAETFHAPEVLINKGSPITYDIQTSTDNRSAYGKALEDLARLNNADPHKTQILGISCDLEGSVKMSAFKKTSPGHFFECGIQEHHSAVMAGALSKENFQVFFSTFGVFGVDEVYNQQRLNAFNHTNLKTVCTHLGLNVGEDGPTHQSVDYIGLLRNIFGYQVFIPADPNQTDHIIRYVAGVYGNCFVGMGRSKAPVIQDQQKQPFFGQHYHFTPGKADIIKDGHDACLLTYGPLLSNCLEAAASLEAEHSLKIKVLNFASIVPADTEAILDAARQCGLLITVEDHIPWTGLGAIVDTTLAEHQVHAVVKHLGVTHFASSGIPSDLYRLYGMDTEGLKRTTIKLLQSKRNP